MPVRAKPSPAQATTDAAPAIDRAALECGWSVDLASEAMAPQMRAKLSPAVTTPEGFLLLEGWAARSGVQAYPERPEGQRAQYRPAEEVSDAQSLASWVGRPLTVQHPQQRGDAFPLVTPDNWTAHAAGSVLGAEWDAQLGHVKVKILAQSQEAIDALTDPQGPRQLSAGYLRQLDTQAGKAPDGTPYDSVQRQIRINHLALVPQARAGQTALVGLDSKGKQMEFVEVTINGRKVRVAKEDAAVLGAEADAIVKAQAEADKRAAEAKTKADAADKRAAEAEAKLLAAEADLKTFKDAQSKEEVKRLRAELKALLPETQVGELDAAGLKRVLVVGAYPELSELSLDALLAVYPKAVERLKAGKAGAASELGGAPEPSSDALNDDPAQLRRKMMEQQAGAWKSAR